MNFKFQITYIKHSYLSISSIGKSQNPSRKFFFERLTIFVGDDVRGYNECF